MNLGAGKRGVAARYGLERTAAFDTAGPPAALVPVRIAFFSPEEAAAAQRDANVCFASADLPNVEGLFDFVAKLIEL